MLRYFFRWPVSFRTTRSLLLVSSNGDSLPLASIFQPLARAGPEGNEKSKDRHSFGGFDPAVGGTVFRHCIRSMR